MAKLHYRIPKTSFVLATDHLRAGCETACLCCGERFRLGTVALAMRAGHETIGFLCPPCLKPKLRAQLIRMLDGGQVGR